MMINWNNTAIWALKLIAAIIMLQTLYFKFTGADESIYIFSQLGMEPWGRIGTGVLELIASLLILYPRSTHFGALLAAGLAAGLDAIRAGSGEAFDPVVAAELIHLFREPWQLQVAA